MNKRTTVSVMSILCGCTMAASAATVIMGTGDGLGKINHFETNPINYYTEVWGVAPTGVVDIAMIEGGAHVMTASALYYFEYDSELNIYTNLASYSWGGATGRCVAVASDGTVFAGGSSGFGSFDFDPNASSNHYGDAATDWYNSDIYDIAIDTNDYVHVAQIDGISGWDPSAGNLSEGVAGTALTGWIAGSWVANQCIEVDSGNRLYVGKSDGMGDLVYDPTTGDINTAYTFGGNWQGGFNYKAIEIDETGNRVFGIQDGVGVIAVEKSNMGSILAWGGGAWEAVCVDSDGNIHLGKADGMGRFITQPGASAWEDLVWDNTSWYVAADVKVIINALAEPIPPIPAIGAISIVKLAGTDAVAITWATGDSETYQYALETRDSLMLGNWATNTMVSGNGGNVTVTAAVDQVQSFFRVSGE